MKGFLLATAPDIEGIKRMISAYWFNPAIKLGATACPYTYDVYQSEKRMENFRVIQKGKRFRFEAIVK